VTLEILLLQETFIAVQATVQIMLEVSTYK